MKVASTAQHERVLAFEMLLPSPVATVWQMWTTVAGLQSFFAPHCQIELKPDGLLDIHFFPDNAPGLRGAEGMRIMAVQPPTLLSFTWDFPPKLPTIRKQRTLVVVRLSEVDGGTRLNLTQSGWGEGGEWEQGFQYFSEAWGDVVLPRLNHALTVGPVDWTNH